MNIIKSFSEIFLYHKELPELITTSNITTDIEDICYVNKEHKDKEYKENSVFNGLLESLSEEFDNNIEAFKDVSDIDRFKKNIQKK